MISANNYKQPNNYKQTLISANNMWIACLLHLMFISQSIHLISSMQKKTTTKVTKRGVQKAHPKMQPGVFTRSQKNRPVDVTAVTNQAEICNQPTEEG